MQSLLALKLPDGTNIDNPPGFRVEFTSLASIVNVAIPYIMAIAGVILLGVLIWGGFDYLTSGGDPKKADAGKNKITSAIIGFVIIFAAYWILQIIDFVFKLGYTK